MFFGGNFWNLLECFGIFWIYLNLFECFGFSFRMFCFCFGMFWSFQTNPKWLRQQQKISNDLGFS